MDSTFYAKFTDRIGRALEVEDRLILGAASVRNDKHKGGCLRFQNEHYYHSILLRGALSHWDADIEKDGRYDLVLYDPEEPGKLYAAFELKTWMSTHGRTELPGIGDDIVKLRQAPCDRTALILVAGNPRSETEKSIAWLEGEWLRRKDFAICPRRQTYRFDTIDPWGQLAECWIGVWPIKSPETPESVPAAIPAAVA